LDRKSKNAVFLYMQILRSLLWYTKICLLSSVAAGLPGPGNGQAGTPASLTTTPFCLKLKTADGRIMDAEYSINLMHDRNGRLSGVIGVGRDITERMRTEEAIRRRNIELTAIAGVTQALSQQLKLNRVINIALDKILEVSGLSAGGDMAAG
jgi:hypothetical protein